jgi:Asp-tRNA(Asn)/Glu-tRNA(Gln) amidotransferase A subunit family amidase
LTTPGNLSDATALAIPFGTFDGRLPRAIQLMGPPGSERALLDLADRIIEARDRDPKLAQPRVELS